MRGSLGLLALALVVPALQAQGAAQRVEDLRQVGRYDEAERVARAAQLWDALGEILAETGRRTAADTAFNRAARTSDSLTARFHRAELLRARGRRAEAAKLYDSFITVYNRAGRPLTSAELAAVAGAVERLSETEPALARDALRAYDEAIAADSSNLEARVALGELFLGRYNGTDARSTFEGALARNPKHPGALVGLARTARFDGSGEAAALVDQALEVNPRFVPGLVFRAQLAAEAEDYAAAARDAERALRVNPTALEALAVLGAVRYLTDDSAGWRAAAQRAQVLDSTSAEFDRGVAELCVRNRRYAEAVQFAAHAVARDPTSARALAVLGVNELRIGRIDSGRVHLERAFAIDPFDVWTKNTLDLLDNLVTYREITTPHFQIALDSSNAPLLALYVGAVAEEAYDSLSRRYRMEPATPIRVELYPHDADFSVRTVGLVGMGALGVSFGPVIAMDAPVARDSGDFNWASTLWHELSHTFHLALTEGRVPRWFTEGLAVYEERRARPGWGMDVSIDFLAAFKDDRLQPVSELNEGFTRPAYPAQLLHSYYEASLVCEWLATLNGDAVLRDMLMAYRAGRSTEGAFQSVLGLNAAEVDQRFHAYLAHRFATALPGTPPFAELAEHPPARAQIERAAAQADDFLAQLRMGRLLVEEERYREAVPYLARAKALFPEYAGPGTPYWYLAVAYREQRQPERAIAELQALLGINAGQYEAYMELARLLEQAGRRRDAAGVLARSMSVWPMAIEPHRHLAELAEADGDFATAVRERHAVVALDPVNRVEAFYRLARVHFAARQLDSARTVVLQALELAPSFPAAQELLLAIHAARVP